MDWVFLGALVAGLYEGAPKWALLLGAAILAGVHSILGAMTEVGREADRQIADLKSQLSALRASPGPRAYDDY